MSVKVFVYGTLRKGYGNHERLMGEAKYVRDGITKPEYTMISLGNFPGVFSGGNTPIKGEIYEVGLATLARLDQLEGHPHFYKRTPIELQDGEQVRIYLYRPPVKDSEIQRFGIQSGDWNDRDNIKRD